MTFLKVKRQATDHFTGWTTIPGELVTERERNTKFRYLMDDVFEPVEVSRKKTFWSFGCRFEKTLPA